MSEQRSDAELVAKSLAGAPESFAQLVARYKDAVFGVAFHHLGDFEDARDATQETFIKAFRDLAQLKRHSSFAYWLHRIANGTALDLVRRRRRTASLSETPPLAVPPSAPDPDLAAQVTKALSDLSEPTRLALILHHVNGYSHAEIADFLGVTPGAIKTRLSRARNHLREEMTDMVEDGLRAERPVLRCEFSHPRQRNTLFSCTTDDTPEEELRKGLLARGFRIKDIRVLSKSELLAEQRAPRRHEAKLVRDALTRAITSQADAVRFSLGRSDRWLNVQHLIAGKWKSAARLATSGGEGLEVLDKWTGRRLHSRLRAYLLRMTRLRSRENTPRQTGTISLRLLHRTRALKVIFNRKSIRIDLA